MAAEKLTKKRLIQIIIMLIILVSAFVCAIYTLSWPSLNRERWGVRLKHSI